MTNRRAAAYNLDINIPAVAVGAATASVTGVIKVDTTVKHFDLLELAHAHFDANGVLAENVNFQLTAKRGSETLFDGLALAAIGGRDRRPYRLPERRLLNRAEEVIITVRVRPGSVAGVLSLALIGVEQL